MSAELFIKPVEVRFRHADPAGIMFFGNVYKIAHDTYEDFITYLGFEWSDWFKNEDWAVPIRHSSCEHFRPMFPSKVYDVHVFVERIGKSSFTLKYVFVEGDDAYCEVSLVHTFYNIKSHTKMTMPSDIRDRLEAYQRESLATE